MSDHDYQNVNVRTVDLWMLMCACQTMMLFEHLSPASHEFYRDLGKRLQAIVVAIHPEARELSDRGWDTFVGDPGKPGPVNPYNFWRRYAEDDNEEGDDWGTGLLP
jgi:hypothetical protein